MTAFKSEVENPSSSKTSETVASVRTRLENMSLDDQQSFGKRLLALVDQLGQGEEQRAPATLELATLVKSHEIQVLNACDTINKIKEAANDKKNPSIRAAAMIAVMTVVEALGALYEPTLVPSMLPVVLDLLCDKNASVRTEAEQARIALGKLISPNSIRAILPLLFQALDSSRKWQTKIGALNIIATLTERCPESISYCLPNLIPVISDCMWSTKPEEKNAASETMVKICSVVGNPDIEPMLPLVIGCIANPSQVSDCVYRLAATTFVKTVEGPTLAVMVPLLLRGLNEPATAVKRQAAVIIDNMCKLVEDPKAAQQFLPQLMPGLDRIIEIHADPECRAVCERARATLVRVGGGGEAKIKTAEEIANEIAQEEKSAFAILSEIAPRHGLKMDDVLVKTHLTFISVASSFLVDRNCLEVSEWEKHCVVPYLVPFMSESEAKKMSKQFLDMMIENIQRKERARQHQEEEEGEDLCDCEFSLAYGGMVLLNNTRFKLKRGKRYGLCGPNGVGKSTLMRSIANGQLDGFPSQDEVKTVYVAHELQATDTVLSVQDFVLTDSKFKDSKKEDVIKTLQSVGFSDVMLQMDVTSLSGGWKMKLELARAMLMHADILLLDEPTNHLDVANVKWLENYLTSLPHVTSIVVSHDSSFLDTICTHIIHYENRKLKTYRGNLTAFVKVRPEAKAYYELESTALKFKFPEPGFLEGINSKDKAILKMKNVNFTYPGATKQALFGITCQASLSSRIAVLGPNGAGKSTLIKVFTGEMEPSTGEVWKHPNLRIAYVAQHAFHHLEKHLDKTPNQYIQWRYQYGEDKELLAKASRQIPEEELVLMEKPIVIDGEKRFFDLFMGRRKVKKTYEYEIKWRNLDFESNTWIAREEIEKWGFKKTLQAFDDKEAANAGAFRRALTAVNVEKHLNDVGLESEFASHSHIRGLSGGQKVKVVLAAAMWDHPHLLVLDEPTNYLDRDSLGALAGAIKEFGGGVVMISHHREFTAALCPETWTVDAGILSIDGAPTNAGAAAEKIEWKVEDEKVDAFGNVEKVKQKKTKLSRKEQKAKERRKKNAMKNGEAISDDDDDDLE